MGWNDGLPTWSEMERVLSGRPKHSTPDIVGDGGDSPAWSRKREVYEGNVTRSAAVATPYAELHAHSAFSFLDGASQPEAMVEEAVRLGLESIAITDHDGFYGVVRFAEAAKALGIGTVFGAELSLGTAKSRAGELDPDGMHLLVLARGQEGYRRLSREIATAHLAGGVKGKPQYDFDALSAASGGHWQILTGCRKGHVRRA
ncbi:MAG: PHP domain-containing protein, partial [Rhodococcus sp. (in: high G+C Gram-positive bacteria)]